MFICLHIDYDCFWATAQNWIIVSSKLALFTIWPFTEKFSYLWCGEIPAFGGLKNNIESFSFGRLWMTKEWNSWSLKVTPSPPSSFILNSSWVELLLMNACGHLFFLTYLFPLDVCSYLSTLSLQHQLFRGKQPIEFPVFSRHILWLSSLLDSPTIHFSLLLHLGCWLLLEKFTQLGQLITTTFMVSHLC